MEKTTQEAALNPSSRLRWLDNFRGIAISLMVIFHFFYDLNYFRFVSIRFLEDPFWLEFRWLIVSMFLFAVGVSLGIVHRRGIRWTSVRHRALLLGGASGAISLITWLLFPAYWIYFGILHFIFVASLLGLPFVGRVRASLLVGGAILLLYWSGLWQETGFFELLKGPLHLPRYTLDLVPLLPWMGVVLLGVSFSGAGMQERFERQLPTLPLGPLRWAGRHALAIYLLHQPLLFGGVYLAWWLAK
ncbi:heparan-alpha-glucosaminide N-acetyltransferase [Nitratifractor sp.]